MQQRDALATMFLGSHLQPTPSALSQRVRRKRQAAVPVTLDNFIRAETDTYE
jgi:hypothetical protein